MPSQLRIYLRNQHAAARAGLDLFRRTVSNHKRKVYADQLRELAGEAKEDLASLRQLMRHLSVTPDQLMTLGLRLGERAGRLKPNGHLVRRAPLSDLLEIEGLLMAVHLKATAWQALSAAGVAQGSGLDLDELSRRAQSQRDRLQSIHRTVAATSLRRT